MRTLHIVMAMAGRGSRFSNVGYTTPKPLIKVDGQPMFLRALSSLDNVATEKRYTIIIRQEHDEQYNLGTLLKEALPDVNIVFTNEEPIGAVVDALRSRTYLKPDEGVVVMDCDLWFQSASYNNMVQASLSGKSNIAGGLLTFEADNPRYSYAKFGDDGIVTETAEKRVISNHAITGAYYFATATDFITAAETLIAQPLSDTMPEYYMSLLYNILIQDGKKVQAATVDEFASFGTPEELAAYDQMQKRQ